MIDEPLYATVREDERLRSESHDIDDELGYVDGILRVDSDGWRFIDYLRAGEQEFDEIGDYLTFLPAYERLIHQGLADAVAEPHLQPKTGFGSITITYSKRCCRSLQPGCDQQRRSKQSTTKTLCRSSNACGFSILEPNNAKA